MRLKYAVYFSAPHRMGFYICATVFYKDRELITHGGGLTRFSLLSAVHTHTRTYTHTHTHKQYNDKYLYLHHECQDYR